MKCVLCGKQLPRSRRGRRSVKKLYLFGSIFGWFNPQVHAAGGCYTKLKDRIDHAIWVWGNSMLRTTMTARDVIFGEFAGYDEGNLIVLKRPEEGQ